MEQNCSICNYLPGLLLLWLWSFGLTDLEGRYSDTARADGQSLLPHSPTDGTGRLRLSLWGSSFLCTLPRQATGRRARTRRPNCRLRDDCHWRFRSGSEPRYVSIHRLRPRRGGPQEIVLRNSGRVVMDLGLDRRSEPIGENGQAFFPAIPANFRGQNVHIAVESANFETINSSQELRLDGRVLSGG